MNLPSDADHGGALGRAPWRDPALLVATCGGVGRMPIAPGTAGAAVGVAGTAVEAVLVACICLVGVPICGRAAALLGRGKDPGAVVYDEMAALPLVLLPVPPAARSLVCLAAAFVLFRIFDIAKPWPCRRLERLPAGWGIMADDWAAAAWAAACLGVARSLGVV